MERLTPQIFSLPEYRSRDLCLVNSREYQYHLLRLTYHETAVPIVNNFNVSQLKQRSMMMNQSKSPAYRGGRYLLMLHLVLLFLTADSLYASQRETAEVDLTLASALIPAADTIEPEEIFIDVEVQPEFPGGMKEFMKFISENLKYPEPRGCQDMHGRVICSFVVMKDGKISDVKVVRGLHPHLDAEAIRVLQSMPKWKPGTHRGQAVNVLFTSAVVFRLQ